MKTPQPEMSLVSVVIPCRNERGLIGTCLASTLNQMEPAGGFEVIVADGMSDDGTREILERIAAASSRPSLSASDGERAGVRCAPSPITHLPSSHPNGPVVSGPSVRLIDNPGKIVSTGLNAAIRAARGEIIIRMDAHTQYAPDYIVECVRILEQTGADNVGGPWVAKGDGYVSRAVATAFQSPFAVGGARSHALAHEGEVDSVYLGCWPRKRFERFGYFDEELVRNQDDEHNLRIIRGGGKVYQSPKIKSWYRPRGSLSALFRQYTQYGYWKVRVIQKHKLPASWRHLVPGAFVFTLLILSLLSVLGVVSSAMFQVTTDHRPLTTDLYRLPADLLIGLLGFYALCVGAASALTAAKFEWKLLPILPFVFGCYHFGYGFGFLRGILDFVILRRGASVSFTKLTRASSEAKAAVRSP